MDQTHLNRHMTAFLTHELSADAFHDWFFRMLWDIEQTASDADVALAATIENRLAEYTGGYISAEVLREALRDDTREALAASASGRIPA